MADEEKSGAEEPEINAVAVNLADLVDDEDEIEEEEPEEEAEKGSDLGDLMGDIFAEEVDDDDHLKAFGDLEHLTVVEVSSEVEAVLEELRMRQGDND